MVIATVDSRGCYGLPACRVPSMPDMKEFTPDKQSVWQRHWLPKWMLRDRYGSRFSSLSNHRKWVANHDNRDRPTSTTFPQKPLTDTAASLPISEVSSRNGYPIASPGNRRAVSADSGRARDEDYPIGEVLSSRLSAPEIQRGNESTNSSQCFGSDSACLSSKRFKSDAYAESIPPHGENFKEVFETELDKLWILNLSLRFRNGSDREKFFVTYVETPSRWRRVTVSCDYGRSEPGSLEQDLSEQPYQGEKNARIYDSLRESIPQIQFFDTVTNLRLETIDGQLHVNVAEDTNEIIPYPTVSMVRPLGLPLISESRLIFETHFSGFAYQVKYEDRDYVKKEMPGPDGVDEFLYEINALYELRGSKNVIQLEAIVVDDAYRLIKGLLLNFAAKGDLAGLLGNEGVGIQWERRESWAKQIVDGLAALHEAGFVQGDLTLTNVVVDDQDNAKIIDINRRGCPIGWEAPEFKRKLENKQSISMYIGVKSDLFQLGMVLWALAMEVDQPERHPRPLAIPGDVQLPGYYRKLVQTCLSQRPQDRLSAKELLEFFPQKQISPAPGMAHNAAEDDMLVSFPRPLQNGTVCSNKTGDYSDRLADNVQAVGVLNDSEARQYTSSLSESLHCHNGPSTRSRGYNGPNHNPRSEIDAGLFNNLVSPGDNLVEGSNLTVDAGRTAVQDQDTGIMSSSVVREAENDIEVPVDAISLGDVPLPSGPACSSAQIPLPGDLSFIGSHPSCLPDDSSTAAIHEHSRPDALCTTNEARLAPDQVSNDSAGGNVASETTRGIQSSEVISVSNTNQTDTLSSYLPINPAFRPGLAEEQQYGSARSDSNSNLIESPGERSRNREPRKLRRVTFVTNLNDLFTSHLPINPRHMGQDETVWECLSTTTAPRSATNY